MSLITTARRVFYSSFIEYRALSSINPLGNSTYGLVVPTAPKLQARNSKNKGILVK
jgi:hypothetical protein